MESTLDEKPKKYRVVVIIGLIAFMACAGITTKHIYHKGLAGLASLKGPPGTKTGQCRPCTADDGDQCTHPGNADQAWCNANCPDDVYDQWCPPSHCYCEEEGNLINLGTEIPTTKVDAIHVLDDFNQCGMMVVDEMQAGWMCSEENTVFKLFGDDVSNGECTNKCSNDNECVAVSGETVPYPNPDWYDKFGQQWCIGCKAKLTERASKANAWKRKAAPPGSEFMIQFDLMMHGELGVLPIPQVFYEKEDDTFYTPENIKKVSCCTDKCRCAYIQGSHYAPYGHTRCTLPHDDFIKIEMHDETVHMPGWVKFNGWQPTESECCGMNSAGAAYLAGELGVTNINPRSVAPINQGHTDENGQCVWNPVFEDPCI